MVKIWLKIYTDTCLKFSKYIHGLKGRGFPLKYATLMWTCSIAPLASLGPSPPQLQRWGTFYFYVYRQIITNWQMVKNAYILQFGSFSGKNHQFWVDNLNLVCMIYQHFCHNVTVTHVHRSYSEVTIMISMQFTQLTIMIWSNCYVSIQLKAKLTDCKKANIDLIFLLQLQ